MTLSVILDIAIGLFVVFFIISTMASIVSEIVAIILGRRANNMAQFILDVFKGQKDKAAKFYKSSSFEMNQVGWLNGLLAGFGRFIHLGSPLVPKSENVLSIPDGSFSTAIFDALELPKNAALTADNVRQTLAQLPDCPLKNALLAALQQSDDTVEKVVTNLDKWFDGQMEQLTELYKRRTRYFLFVIGFLLAFILNVDSITIVQALQQSSTLRGAAVAFAQTVTNPNATTGSPTETSLDQVEQQINDLTAQLTKLNTQLNQLGFPVGWGTLDNINWGSKILGFLITGLAVTLGAPFWFDTLKTLTSRPASSSG